MQHSRQERDYSLTVIGRCNVDYHVSQRRKMWHLTRPCAQVFKEISFQHIM